MNVLSIDFDYFQNVTKEQLALYPDGVDLAPLLSDVVWSSHYYSYGDELKKIAVNIELCDQMLNILSFQDENTPVMITNSHVHAHNFILKHRGNEKVNLVNIDLHHDYTNNNPTLDCGNWIEHLENAGAVSSLRWICREISLEMYGFSEEEKSQLTPMCLGFDSIKNTEFDLIFICRSDPWFPPHLDWSFERFINSCKAFFLNITAEKRILEPRTINNPKINYKPKINSLFSKG